MNENNWIHCDSNQWHLTVFNTTQLSQNFIARSVRAFVQFVGCPVLKSQRNHLFSFRILMVQLVEDYIRKCNRITNEILSLWVLNWKFIPQKVPSHNHHSDMHNFHGDMYNNITFCIISMLDMEISASTNFE